MDPAAAPVATATVGLLFSDIEGSTRLLQQLGPAYLDVLVIHRQILRAAFDAHCGEEQGTEGDSFFVTFPAASDAVAAALAAQRSLAAHPWPPDATVRVRMGLHVGEIQTVAGSTVGMAIHEAARIGAAAHGGQVLVSSLVAHLAGPLPEDATWLDLGQHRLKDISAPVQLLQLMHPELATRFPPPRSQGGSRNNLPAQANAFIGREADVAEIDALLGETRLLTVVGAGGGGKSRIALRVAAEQASRFDDGVWFIDLAPIAEGTAVAQQIAGALGLSDVASDDLRSAIGQRSILLLLDNCEHMLDAVSELVDDLLIRCPGVKVLATSREPIGIKGEVAWRLPSLDDSDAIELFCTRARAVNSRFVLTDSNRSAVVDVCRRLDAIPLALELAAARLGSLTVEQLASRLDHRFRLLDGGTRGGMARQRTLQATVDWSYDLLSGAEQASLRRLGTFIGGFTLEAAEVVCATGGVDPLDVLHLVEQLVAKSLVMAEEHHGQMRYRLLETVRHYALDRLLQAGELTAARDAQMQWLARLASEAEPVLWFGGDATGWMERLDTEDGNLRAALAWAVEKGELSLATAMLFATMMWFAGRSRLVEGLEMCDRLLAAGANAEDASIIAFVQLMLASHGRLDETMFARIRANIGSLRSSSRAWLAGPVEGYMAAMSIDGDVPDSALRAMATCQAAADAALHSHPTERAMTLQALTWASMEAGELDVAHDAAEEATALMKRAGLRVWESRLAANLAHVAIRAGDLDAAWRYAEQSVEAARHTSDTWVVIAVTQLLSEVAARRGDLRSARDLAVSLLDAAAEAESDQGLAGVHRDIAWYALLDGDREVADSHATRATELVERSEHATGTIFRVAGETARANGDLRRAWDLHLRAGLAGGLTGSASADSGVVASVIEGLAGVRAAIGDGAGAALLLGSAAAHRPDAGSRLEAENDLVAAIAEAARALMGAEAFNAAANEGAVLDLHQALAVASKMPPPPP